MDLQKIITANTAARALENINIADFALNNPQKWEPDFLRTVLEQYKFLQKLQKKLPSWYENGVLGAGAKAIEQCSSEETGHHKFKNYSGKMALDLTGGFGVDSYFIAQKFEQVISCEANEVLQSIVKYNFQKLGVKNVTFVNQKAEDFLAETSKHFDLIYLDPDRRSDANKKLVLLEDCTPNLIEIQDQLSAKSEKILVKYSPLLDIPLAVGQIKNVEQVEIVALKNEVKELLFSISKSPDNKIVDINAVNIKADKIETLSHALIEEKHAKVSYALPNGYLYEPNAAILKSGAFKLVGIMYGANKIAQHSHYYTSDNLIENFPGKAFQIESVLNYNSKALKPFSNQSVNVLARNFPMKVETIRQKHRLKNGGENYLIFTQNHKSEKIILYCRRTF